MKENKDVDSLSHTTWRGQYHGVFAPKYRRMVIYGQIKQVRQVWKSAFLARGYFVDTVGKNKKKIQEYIKNQLQQDQIADQLSLKEFVDPFTGSKEIKA